MLVGVRSIVDRRGRQSTVVAHRETRTLQTRIIQYHVIAVLTA